MKSSLGSFRTAKRKNNSIEIKMENVYNYFSNTNISDKVMCNICNKQLSSSRPYNLKIHLRSCHKIEISENKAKKTLKRNGKKLIKETIELNKCEIIRAYIGLVTENGVAFDLLNSSNMKKLMKPICSAINKKENLFTLNSENAKGLLSNVVKKLRNIIKHELDDNLFSVKIDSATRLDRNFFGISIQYCKDASIISRVIGMSELKGVGCSKSINLASEVIKTLNKFDLSLQQVISITSDNGANMLKATSLLSQCVRNNNEIEYLDNEKYLMLLKEIDSDKNFNIGDITVCRCAAHTAQLVAIDSIKSAEILNLVLKTRNLVKLLRKPSNGLRSLFEANQLRIPQTDCLTRWGSTFQMISDIKSSRNIIENMDISAGKESDDLEINEKYWDDVTDFVLVFAPLNEILLKFQEQSLNYGDFYAHWIRCKLLIKKVVEDSAPNPFLKNIGTSLLANIETRSKKLLENNFLRACLFLDPRFQHTLQPHEREQAIEFLKTLWEKFILVKKDYVRISKNSCETEDTIEEDILTTFLKPQCTENIETATVYTKIERLKLPFLKSTICVLKYWIERRSTDPELYILSNIIFGVPPTQVSVERAFSSLKLILTDCRNRLGEENLENILLAKLNSTLLDEIIDDLI